jgi:hypothetical protein
MGARSQITNNAVTTLAVGIGASDTSFTVASGTGNLFPSSGYFTATLYDNSGNLEIIKVSARSVDTFSTVVRAQEGTTARAFSAGSKVRLNLTAAVINELAALPADNTFTGNNTFSGSVTSSGTNTFSGSNTFSGTVTHNGVETFNNSSSTFSGTAALATQVTSTVADAAVVNGNQVGYRDVPSNSITSAYTLQLTDRGKSIDFSGGSGLTVTIPSNIAVAFPVGSTITITNFTTYNLSIAINTDNLILAGTTLTGTRTLANYGVATVRKVASTSWIISGAGLS